MSPATRRRSPLAVALAVVGVVVAVGVAVFVAIAWRSAIAPLDAAPPPGAFDRAVVRRGAGLAAAGNCIGCHQTLDGAPWAGGVAIRTPFGTVHGSNLSPDPATGIGRWSEAAFRRALREGVARDGSHLYPAFPYDHYTRLADADIGALYAFLMTRDPVLQATPANDLVFPLGFRPLLAGWKLLFLREGPLAEHANDRGAYLADALAHCGGCHTPRNALGAEKRDQALSGGEAEGWYAPSLTTSSPSPLPWTREAMVAYLTTGLAEGHAIAGGPMQQVVLQLGQAPREDVEAIADTAIAWMGPVTDARRTRGERSLARAAALAASGSAAGAADDPGHRVYLEACAGCHDRGREAGSAGALQLPLAVALHEPTPQSLLRIVRDGIAPLDGTGYRWMPAYDTSIADADLVALLGYLRRAQADLPPWPDTARSVAASRR